MKELSLRLRLCDIIQPWLEGWANFNYTPRKLNIVVDTKPEGLMMLTFNTSLQSCVSILRNKTLQRSSDLEDTAWVNIYFKTSSVASIPFVQLRVTNSSVVLLSVKASKYGILGLDHDVLHLTEGSYHGKKVYKAMLTGTNNEYIDTSVTSLSSVTYLMLHVVEFYILVI